MHYKTISELLKELNTTINGLSQEEAERRLKFFGPNTLEEEEESRFKIFIRQFTSPFIVILIFAGFLALFLGDLKDSLVVFGLVTVNGLIGFYQEVKAQASIKALKALTAFKTKVYRDGKELEIDVNELVPGDVVELGEGDVVPADIRLVDAVGLLVDEAMLTGESIPVAKEVEKILPEDTPLHARNNCLYKGTVIVRGKAFGIVFATGKNTELGRIAQRVLEKSPESPLNRALGSFGKRWILILFIILSSLITIGYFQGRELKTLAFFAVAQLVSAVPEGLPIVVTIALVVGAVRLSREKTLVKYLPAVETLGSATFICSDKTGTITLGKLRVEDYVAYDRGKLHLCAVFCNDSDGLKGDPLEVALIEWLEREEVRWDFLRAESERVWEHPFDTKRRLMAVIVESKNGEGLEFYVKGALESLAKMSREKVQEEVFRAHDELASRGLRVLAFGYAKLTNVPLSVDEVKIEIVGLVGFLDPPKEGVREAVELAKQAGIRVIMITGDNLLTAKAVAELVGIHREGENILLEGKDLEKLEDHRLYELLQRVSVVARATPEDKYRIVKVLQEHGEIVAVTGDGANDAPALRVADLGIAMGSGSQAAKDASKMIIVDNNLAVIVNAIKNGRQIAKNISKVIRYLVSTSFFEVSYNSLAILLGLPLPFYATQILWINLVTDGVQDKAFPFTKFEGNPMRVPPLSPEKIFLGRSQFIKIIYNGLLMAILHLLLFNYLLSIYPYDVALTISFTSAVISQWAVGIQEIGEKPFLKNIREYIALNPFIYIGIFVGLILQTSIILFIPHYFHAVTLSFSELPFVLIIPILTFFGIEIRKILIK